MNKQSKHIPIRTCVACGEKTEKSKMLRIVKKEDETIFDKKQKKDGRGFYICPNTKCIEKTKKGKRYSIKMENVEELKKEISGLGMNRTSL